MGQASPPSHLAVNPVAGTVYAGLTTSAGTGAVWALDGGTLAVTHTISLSDSFPGIDVDPATGTFYVTDRAGVYAVDGSGCPIAQISAAAAADVTVDSTAGTVLAGEN
ncbi:MAG: hypothetical protein WAL72_09985 [Streptosporangiaceae bacterium]